MEQKPQITIAAPVCAEFTEKKSRFIGQLFPAENEDEAKAMLADVRNRNKGARHNVYAWIIGEQDQFTRSSDDGEPAGTGGKPVLESLKKANLHNVVLIVTRYFGGVLLGAGGLTRAYARAAQMAIDQSQKICRTPAKKIVISIDYTFLTKAESILNSLQVQIRDKIFSDKVCIICAASLDIIPQLAAKLQEASNGSYHLEQLAESAYLEQYL